jgi:two-component system NarL family response regulator
MGLRVLIVDDHQVFRHAVASALRKIPGVETVVTASDGTAALNVCHHDKPQLALIDAIMEPAGEATVRALKLACPEMECIGITAWDNEDERLKLIEAGCSRVLDKAHTEDLIAIIEARARRAAG